MPYLDETPLENHYAVFRQDNGGLKVRKVCSSIVFQSLATGKSRTFHVVEGYGTRFHAESMGNFAAVMEIDPITRPRGEYISWLQRVVRTRLNEWIV